MGLTRIPNPQTATLLAQQTFNSSGTFTIPGAASGNSQIVFGGTGGGGGGASGFVLYNNYGYDGTTGGAGGSYGQSSTFLYQFYGNTNPANTSITVTIGAGGTAGNARVVTGTSSGASNPGFAGGSSSVNLNGATLTAGSAGQGGQPNGYSAGAGYPAAAYTLTPNNGIVTTGGGRAGYFNSATPSTYGITSTDATWYGGGAGGAGGNSSNASTTAPYGGVAGASGTQGSIYGVLSGGVGTGGAASTGNGVQTAGNGNAATAGTGSGGGGGGYAATNANTATGGNGGAGANPGGGGGAGGGANRNASGTGTGGAGGNGGGGIVTIFIYQ